MTVAKICQREVNTVGPEESVRAAAQRMRKRRCGALVVVDATGRVIGMLTDRDIVARIVAQGGATETVPVRDAMTREVKVASERTPIEDVVAAMRAGGFRRVPIVGSNGRLEGIVALDDVLSLLSEEFAEIGRLLERSAPRAPGGGSVRSLRRRRAARPASRILRSAQPGSRVSER
jgi:CBS domain-containing protein